MPWSKDRLREYDKTRDRTGAYEASKFGPQRRERRGAWVECQTCGREFYVNPARLRQVAAKGYNVRFCSKSCYGTGKEGSGNPFYGRTHSEETKTRFLENPNRHIFEKGAENPNTDRFGPEFRGISDVWFRRFLHRTQGRCGRCGYDAEPGILQMHHRDRNRRHNSEENLELLCPNCHMLEHFKAKDGHFGGYHASKRPPGWTPMKAKAVREAVLAALAGD